MVWRRSDGTVHTYHRLNERPCAQALHRMLQDLSLRGDVGSRPTAAQAGMAVRGGEDKREPRGWGQGKGGGLVEENTYYRCPHQFFLHRPFLLSPSLCGHTK